MITKNVVLNLDCRDGLSVMDKESVDLVLTSPPYDSLRTYNDSVIWNFDVFQEVVLALNRVIKPGGIVVWIIGDETIDGDESGTSFRQALYFKEIGFKLHDTMIYSKISSRYPATDYDNKFRYSQIFEYMFIFSKGKPKTSNLIKDKPNKNAGQVNRFANRDSTGNLRKDNIPSAISTYGIRTNIWEYFPGPFGDREEMSKFKHPAVFPQQLAEDHIRTWSNPGDLVVDPFAGSGTTLRSSRKLHRDFIGFEIDEEYCRLAQELLWKVG